MWSLWSTWMEYSMVTTGRICQETISIAYGGIPERTITARSTLSRNFCTRSTKPTLYRWSSIFMGTVTLWIHFSMVTHLLERTHKIPNFFLTTAVERSNKSPSINQPSVWLKIKKLALGSFCQKCSQRRWFILSKAPSMDGKEARLWLSILSIHTENLEEILSSALWSIQD